MICNKCGKEWSDKVYPFHFKECNISEGVITMDAPKELSNKEMKEWIIEQGGKVPRNANKKQLEKVIAELGD